MKTVKTNMKDHEKKGGKRLAELEKKIVLESRFSLSLAWHPEDSIKSPSLTSMPSWIVKADHIKFLFPTYKKLTNDPDPLIYLSKCQDFLALQPFSDSDLLATLKTVTHGTA